MLAECVVAFRDLDAGVLREVGDRFEVSPGRLASINSTKYGELAREVPEEGVAGTPEVSSGSTRPKRPRRTTKKG